MFAKNQGICAGKEITKGRELIPTFIYEILKKTEQCSVFNYENCPVEEQVKVTDFE